MGSTATDVLYANIALKVYKVILPERKSIVLFPPTEAARATLFKIFGEKSATEKRRISADLSPPDLSLLKQTFGPSFATVLSLNHGYQTNGKHIPSGMTFLVSNWMVLGSDSVFSLEAKLLDTVGAHVDDIAHLAIRRDLDGTALASIVRMAFQGKLTASEADIMRALIVSLDTDIKGVFSRTQLMTKAQALMKISEASKAAKATSLTFSISLSYVSRTSHASICFPSSASHKVDFSDAELDAARLAPDVDFSVEAQGAMRISQLSPIADEIIGTIELDRQRTKAVKEFYFSKRHTRIADGIVDDDDDVLSKLLSTPGAMILPETGMEVFWLNDLEIAMFDQSGVSPSKEFSTFVPNANTLLAHFKDEFISVKNAHEIADMPDWISAQMASKNAIEGDGNADACMSTYSMPWNQGSTMLFQKHPIRDHMTMTLSVSGARSLEFGDAIKAFSERASVLSAYEPVVNKVSITMIIRVPLTAAVKAIDQLVNVLSSAHRIKKIKADATSLSCIYDSLFVVNIVQYHSRRYRLKIFTYSSSFSFSLAELRQHVCVCARYMVYAFSAPSYSDRVAPVSPNTIKIGNADINDESFLLDYFRGIDDDAEAEVMAKTKDAPQPVLINVQSDDIEDDTTLLRELKRADPRLFDSDTIASGRTDNNKFTTACQKQRQPVVISSDEKRRFDAMQGKGSYGKSVAYGSTLELSQQNHYICPSVWCPKSRIPMTIEEFNKNGQKCPLSDEKPIKFYDKDYWKDINRESGKVEYKSRWVGFEQSKLRTDGLCIPCCYVKPKAMSSKCAARATISLEDAESSRDLIKRSKYIMSSMSPLEDSRFGLLPQWLDRLFMNSASKRGQRHDGTGNFSKSTFCFVRMGITLEDPLSIDQPFFASMVRMLANPKITTINELMDEICNLEIGTFIALSDGLIARTFVEHVKKTPHSLMDADKVIDFLETNQTYVRDYNILVSDERNMSRERLLVSAFYEFRKYVQDSSIQKNPDILIPLFNSSTMYPNLNPGRTLFIFFDSGAATMSKVHIDDGTCKNVVFVLSTGSSNYEAIVHISNKNKPTMYNPIDSNAIVSAVVKLSMDHNNNNNKILQLHKQIHERGQFVQHMVITYDRAMIAFICRDPARGLVHVKLPGPSTPMALALGQSYVYEDDLERYSSLVDRAKGESTTGLIDHAIFTRMMPSAAQLTSSSNTQDKKNSLVIAEAAAKRVRNDPQLLGLVSALRNPLSPLPVWAKRRILEKRLSLPRGDNLVATLSGSTGNDDIDHILDTFIDSLHSVKMTRDGVDNMISFKKGDVISAGGSRRFIAELANPFKLLEVGYDDIMIQLPDVKPYDQSVASLRRNNADLAGDFKPIMSKWNKYMTKYEVFATDISLWEVYERVCMTLGRNTHLGIKGLTSVTHSFIANDEAMLALVAQTNTAMEDYAGDMDSLRRIVMSGACPPSFIELCVLSRIADVRTIILKRKFNGNETDNGIICMNSSPHMAKYVVVFQHKINKDANVDEFRPIVFGRREVVFPETMLSKEFRAIVADACSCTNCWDDRCTLVIEDIAQKKKEHIGSLMQATIKKMIYNKNKKTTLAS